jgi:hypothetical protein
MNKEIIVTKANGDTEGFERDKLEVSLRRAGASEKVVQDIVQKVEEELTSNVSTKEIYEKAYHLLSQEEKEPVSINYSLSRAVLDLGPSGFPFEEFLAAIYRSQGYETKTGETVYGACVEHEVDVVAWNDKKLLMAEAKFHGRPGVKSDLKVALYVKAHFDDLYEAEFDYGKKRKLDEGLLITNTKFTTTATHYAECKGFKLISWNYPKSGNLHDMIVEAKLHPLTCLKTLSKNHKQGLLDKGVVLLRDIKSNDSLLDQVGVKGDEKQRVLEEMDLVV